MQRGARRKREKLFGYRETDNFVILSAAKAPTKRSVGGVEGPCAHTHYHKRLREFSRGCNPPRSEQFGRDPSTPSGPRFARSALRSG
jgi:hypothetical protein